MKALKLTALSLFVGALVPLSGCAGGLNVQVDVLDKGYLDHLNQRDSLRKEARALAIGDFTQTARFLDQANYAVLTQANSICIEEISKKIPFITDTVKKKNVTISVQGAKGRRATLGDPTRLQLNSMREQLTKIDRETSSQINRYYGVGPWITSNQAPLPQPLIQMVASRRSVFEQAALHRDRLVLQMRDECIGMAGGLLEQSDIAYVQTKTDQAVTGALDESILGGGLLLSDQEGAFHVANAPDRYWAKGFNKAMGAGKLGNTSTAIKINGLADYTVKGFSFDGRSTANMVRKLTVPTVGFAAAMAGIPIDVKSNGESGSQEVFDANIVSSAQTELATSEAKDEAFRGAVKSIASMIFAYEDDLGAANGSAEKRKAKANIKATYDANKSLLAN